MYKKVPYCEKQIKDDVLCSTFGKSILSQKCQQSSPITEYFRPSFIYRITLLFGEEKNLVTSVLNKDKGEGDF